MRAALESTSAASSTSRLTARALFDRCARTRTARLWRGARLNAFVKHFRIKQYLKDGRALRIETVVNDPYDLRF
jgi:hypothetical protein